MSESLYRKWRPHLWAEVIGQDHVTHTLQNALRSGRVGQAYLFAGPRGTGKTTTARLLAKAINCLHEDINQRPCDQCKNCKAVNDSRFLDLVEIDAASNTSVDDVRDLRDKINFSPGEGSFRVYIIDEVHMLSTAAFNALLKTLEEPPKHVVFILATTEIHKIPATVLSRCQRHEFRRISVNEIVGQLQKLCASEKLQVEPEALHLIARQATGAMRDAISLLDQLTSTGQAVTLANAQTVLGTATPQMVTDLVSAVIAKQPGAGLTCIHRALDAGSDARQFARQVVDYLRNLLLIRMGSVELVETTPEQRAQMGRHALQFEQPVLLEVIRLFNTAATENRGGWQPSLLLELAFASAIEVEAQPAPVSAPIAAPQAAVSITPPVAVPTPPETRSAPPPPAAKTVTPPPPAAKTTPPPPQTTKPAPPAETAPLVTTPGGLSDITRNWQKICALLRKRRSQAAALLNSGKPLAVREGVLVMGFSSELLKGKMESGDHVQLAREAIAAIVGVDLPITCVVMSAKTNTSTPDPNEVDSDGMVGTALNLGGTVVQKE